MRLGWHTKFDNRPRRAAKPVFEPFPHPGRLMTVRSNTIDPMRRITPRCSPAQVLGVFERFDRAGKPRSVKILVEG
jgi:hypothetical protein